MAVHPSAPAVQAGILSMLSLTALCRFADNFLKSAGKSDALAVGVYLAQMGATRRRRNPQKKAGFLSQEKG